MDQQAEKRKDRKSNRTRQKNKRGDSKVELYDSPDSKQLFSTRHSGS